MTMFSVMLCVVFLLLPKLLSTVEKSKEIKTPFESGFDPSPSSPLTFSIHYFVMTIIFLLFEVELVLLLPLLSSYLSCSSLYWVLTILLFMFILLSTLYEWGMGYLDWLT